MRKILLIFCVIASLSLGVLSACQHSKKQDSISEADMDVSLQEDQVEEAVEEAPSPAVESENDTAQNNDLTDEELLLPVFVTNNQERKFGYMNQSEEWIIPPEYDSADFFSKEGVALVSKGGTAYMIDINGNIITDIKIGDSVGLVERLWSTDSFAKADFIHGNVTILWYDSDYQSKFAPKAHIGFMDMDGNVTNLHHDLVLDSDFNNTMVEAGLYKITNETSGKEGYINTKGEIVIPVEFDTLGLLGENGLIAANTGSKMGYIDENGAGVVPAQYLDAGEFGSNDLAPVLTEEGWGYINSKNEMVIEPQYDDAKPFGRSNIAPVRTVMGWGCINNSGDVIVDFESGNSIWRNLQEACVNITYNIATVVNSETSTIAVVDENGKVLFDIASDDSLDIYSRWGFPVSDETIYYIENNGKQTNLHLYNVKTKEDTVIKASEIEKAGQTEFSGEPRIVQNLVTLKTDAGIAYFDLSGHELLDTLAGVTYDSYDTTDKSNDISVSTWQDAYIQQIKLVPQEQKTMGYYSLFDMDSNSIPELIIAEGETGDTMHLTVYSYNIDHKNIYCAGEFYAPLAECYAPPQYDGLVVITMFQGIEAYFNVYLTNETISVEEVKNAQEYIDACREREPLISYDLNDLSPLQNSESNITETLVSLPYGLTAPVSDFMFPYSSQQILTQEDLDSMLRDDIEEMRSLSQMAINEILVRYGFTFGGSSRTSQEAMIHFQDKDWYKKAQNQCGYTESNALISNMNEIEKENIDLIIAWQMENIPY